LSLFSVVIHYFHVFNASVSPAKANAPLIIDTNAMLPFSITRKFFKTIARRHSQIAQLACDLKLPEFSLCHRGDVYKSPDALAFRQRFRLCTAKRPNHA